MRFKLTESELNKFLKENVLNNFRNAEALKKTGFWGESASGCIILAEDTKRLLFQLRSEHVLEPNTWSTWGGAMEPGESPEQTVKRELKEESGYSGDMKLIPLYIFEHKSGFKYYNYLAIVPHEFKAKLDFETKDYDWTTLDELPSPLHFGLKALLSDTQSLNTIKKHVKGSNVKINESDLKYLIKKVLNETAYPYQYNDQENTQENFIEFTETPEFKNWFGNSKVVDNEGKPLPLYHGSPLGGIENFKTKKELGDNNTVHSSGLKEFGICFTTNSNLASKYKLDRKLNPQYIEDIKLEIQKLKNIMDNVRNNREYNELGEEITKLENKLKGGVYQTYLKMENPYIFDAKGKDGYDGWRELKVDIGYKTAIGIDAIEALSGNNDIYKSNYDGIIARNIIDLHLGGSDYSKYSEFMGDVYMVFSSSQTKIEKEI